MNECDCADYVYDLQRGVAGLQGQIKDLLLRIERLEDALAEECALRRRLTSRIDMEAYSR